MKKFLIIYNIVFLLCGNILFSNHDHHDHHDYHDFDILENHECEECFNISDYTYVLFNDELYFSNLIFQTTFFEYDKIFKSSSVFYFNLRAPPISI